MTNRMQANVCIPDDDGYTKVKTLQGEKDVVEVGVDNMYQKSQILIFTT